MDSVLRSESLKNKSKPGASLYVWASGASRKTKLNQMDKSCLLRLRLNWNCHS